MVSLLMIFLFLYNKLNYSNIYLLKHVFLLIHCLLSVLRKSSNDRAVSFPFSNIVSTGETDEDESLPLSSDDP